MDKWNDMTHRVQQAFLAEEPEAAMSAAFDFVAEFGRTLERIADAMDRPMIPEDPEPEPVPEVLDL